jgi:hypothetical protein
MIDQRLVDQIGNERPAQDQLPSSTRRSETTPLARRRHYRTIATDSPDRAWRPRHPQGPGVVADRHSDVEDRGPTAVILHFEKNNPLPRPFSKALK